MARPIRRAAPVISAVGCATWDDNGTMPFFSVKNSRIGLRRDSFLGEY